MLPCLGVIPPPAQGAAPRGTLCVFVALTPAAPPGDRQEAGPRVCPLTGPVPPQAWADAFRSSPDLTGVVHTYEELKRKGVEFPTADLDALSPIHTPQRVSLRRLPIRRLQSPLRCSAGIMQLGTRSPALRALLVTNTGPWE